MRLIHFFVFFFFFSLTGVRLLAQQQLYTPIKINSVPASGFLKNPHKYNDSVLNNETTLSKAHAQEFYENVNYSVWSVLSSGKVYFDGPLTEYLNEVVKKLLVNKPELLAGIKVYAVKKSSVNAVSYPDGHIFVNTGLLAALENEDQLAFILAHEIVHFAKNHAKNSFEKKIFSIETNTNSNASAYRILKYSRENEFEADASGLQLLVNSPYNATQAGRALKLLGNSLSNFTPNIPERFNNTFFSIDSSMIVADADSAWKRKINGENEEDDFIFNNDDEDIFSTHPDIEKRILAIGEVLNALEYNKLEIATSSMFDEIKSIAEHEIVDNLYTYEQYSLSMFFCLKYLENKNDDPYYHIYLLKNLYMLGYLKSVGQLEKELEDYGYTDDKGVNTLHYYLTSLGTADLRKMSYGYMKTYNENLQQYEDFVFYQALLTDVFIGKDAASAYYIKYATNYPNGKYITIVKKKQQSLL